MKIGNCAVQAMHDGFPEGGVGERQDVRIREGGVGQDHRLSKVMTCCGR
jgi:hypothetical protein